MKADDMVDFRIITTSGETEFRGRYCRALEAKNWHYYEREDGVLLHFRKEHMVCVIGGNILSVLNSRVKAYEMKIEKEDKKGET